VRLARSATVLILAVSAVLGVLGMYARSQPAAPEVRGRIFSPAEVDAIARSAGPEGRRIAVSRGAAHVEDAPLAMLRSGASIWFLFAGGALLMVGGSVMPLARWYAEARGEGAPPLAGMLSAGERAARDGARARRALEDVVDELGGKLAEADARLPEPALPLVSEAIAAAYGRGVVHGMRRAADDLEAQMAELGVDLRIELDEPGPGRRDGPGPG
jgi:hypothetical protein